VIRSYNNFLIALGIKKSGVSYPHLILWSTRADPGSMPATWAIADTTADAAKAVGGVPSARREAGFVILRAGAYEMSAAASRPLAGGGTRRKAGTERA
jgi:hypothetical protein